MGRHKNVNRRIPFAGRRRRRLSGGGANKGSPLEIPQSVNPWYDPPRRAYRGHIRSGIQMMRLLNAADTCPPCAATIEFVWNLTSHFGAGALRTKLPLPPVLSLSLWLVFTCFRALSGASTLSWRDGADPFVPSSAESIKPAAADVEFSRHILA